jgi:hypothetical protein
MLQDKEGQEPAEARADDVPLAAGSNRRLLFISHAMPQDNVFAKWLATQLAIAGYEVWCDVTKLLGGEKFWNDITEAIDSYAFRFLFVSTLEANRKAGTLRELKVALETQEKYGLRDFVVPLKIDQFPFGNMQKPLPDLNGIRFDENWAAGLAQLLKLLEREGAPKSPDAGPGCVAEWYRRSQDRRRQSLVSDETCHSNWFRLRLPQRLHFHRFTGPAEVLPGLVSGLKFPHRVHGSYVACFAPVHEMQLGIPSTFSETVSVETLLFIHEGSEALAIKSFDANNIVSDIVRQAWGSALDGKGLGSFALASGLTARFFHNGALERNRSYFRAPGGRKTYRQLVGNKSKRTLEGKKEPDGFWHYALSASPQLVPFARLVLRHHVIFTDDGAMPWSKPERMQKARRSVCKQWWNREWRDRLFGFAAALTSRRELRVPVGEGQQITGSMAPMNFIGPWTYLEDSDPGLDETTDIELVEDEEKDGDDDETN